MEPKTFIGSEDQDKDIFGWVGDGFILPITVPREF